MFTVTKTPILSQVTQLYRKRNLWQYLNIIFNRKDQHRWKKFGPDRTCAEWILRNGGAVKLTCCPEFLNDYNLIPPEGEKITLTAVDATDSSIMHYGFDHFVGCTQLDKIILNKCNYVYDEALKELQPIGGQLKILQVTGCHNISDAGLLHLTAMKSLQYLNLGALSGVKDIQGVGAQLKAALPNCNVTAA